MKRFLIVSVITGLSVFLGACQTAGERVSANEAVAEKAIVSEIDGSVDDDANLPGVDLDVESLANLITSGLASYYEQWDESFERIFQVANISKDPRLARYATLLSMKQNDCENSQSASALWLQIEPESEHARATASLIRVQCGQIDESLLEFNKMLDKDVEKGIRQVAGIVTRQKNADAALEVMSRLIARHPQSVQVLISSSYVATQFKQPKRAEAWLLTARKLDPQSELASTMLLNLLEEQERDSERSELLAQLVARYPNSAQIQLNYARDLSRQHQYQKALDVLEHLLQNHPDDELALKLAAAIAQSQHQSDVAERYYQKLRSLNRQDHQITLALVRLALAEKQYKKAARYLDQVDDEQLTFQSQLLRAEIAYETQGIKAALRRLQRLIPETGTELVELALQRNYFLVKENSYQEALDYINETLLVLPENEDLMYARALVASEVGNVAVAEKDLRAILEKIPDHAEAMNALGYTLADLTDRYDEAKALIEKALEMSPNAAHMLDSMGWVLYRLQDYEHALEYLQRAFASQKDAEIAAHLGEVLWESGQPENANAIWQQGLEQDSDNRVLLNTMERYGVESP